MPAKLKSDNIFSLLANVLTRKDELIASQEFLLTFSFCLTLATNNWTLEVFFCL